MAIGSSWTETSFYTYLLKYIWLHFSGRLVAIILLVAISLLYCFVKQSHDKWDLKYKKEKVDCEITHILKNEFYSKQVFPPLQQDYNLYKGHFLLIYFGWAMNIIKSQDKIWIEIRCQNIQLKKEFSFFIFPYISFLLLTKVTELQANKYTWNTWLVY